MQGPESRGVTYQGRRDLAIGFGPFAGGYVGGWVAKLYAEGHLFDGQFNNADLAEQISKVPLTRQPGTFWRYGYSADVLGRVIEVASGETLFHFMKRSIFDPLGMTHAKFVLDTPEERALMAEPLPGDVNLVEQERRRRSHPEWESGGGGLVVLKTKVEVRKTGGLTAPSDSCGS